MAVLRALVAGMAGICLAAAAQQGKFAVTVEKKPQWISPGGGGKPFDVTRHLIPLHEIQGGGPPRDGIPALNQPAFVSAAEADRRLRASDQVIGLSFGGVAKAYPVRILNWHEIVNDDVGPQPAAVTW